MAISILPISEFKVSAVTNNIKTGDIFTFGSYPQKRVTDPTLITTLNLCTLSADETVTYIGAKYKRVYFTQYTPWNYGDSSTADYSKQYDNGYYTNTVYWFKFEPLKWRVLSNTNGELFVMAENIIDSMEYDQTDADEITWETCTMRSWLNNDFYNTAFSSTEKAKIKTSNVVNADNSWFGTSGGNNTNDKIFLLSFTEVVNPDYGFNSDDDLSDAARQPEGTDFSKSQGLDVFQGNSCWWLRSPGGCMGAAGYITYDGFVYYSVGGGSVDSTWMGVRPAFKINLSDIYSPVISVAVNPNTASIAIVGTKQLTATVLPSNATKKAVTWSTSNSSIATVSTTGLVTAKAIGKATITCLAKDGSEKNLLVR